MTKFFSGTEMLLASVSEEREADISEQRLDLRQRLEAAARLVESVAYDIAGAASTDNVARLMVVAAELERFQINGQRPVQHFN